MKGLTNPPSPLAHKYPANSIGRLMEAPVAVFQPELSVAAATEMIRTLARERFFTYAYIVDEAGVLQGVVTMRDLLLSEKDQPLSAVMLRNPFVLRADMPLMDAMKLTLNKHFPSYPVCDANGVLVGIARGATIFEQEAIEISAQAGRMVGVEREERIATPLVQSLKFRHPWLQFNLLTAFVAAAVVGVFESTIEKIVVLAVFLPVMAGQSGNTGCQALAVALRGLTLGEIKEGDTKKLVNKEAMLGLANGAMVGLTAGLGMFCYATMQGTPQSPIVLGVIVFLGMVGSCMISGISGVLVPTTLKRLGADPATASSIFLTTATDVASMGIFLGLAAMWFGR